MYNGHGDVTALIGTDGTIAAQYYYDAFGNPVAEGTNENGINNPIRYAGYQWDGETEIYYLNARYYDPKIARFLTEDTYYGSIADPLSLNLYAYCANNPIKYVDPTGHAFTEWDNKNVTDPKDRKDIVDATKEWHEAKTDKERADAHAKAEKARDKYRNDDEEGRDDGHTYKKDSNDISDRYDKDRKRDKKDKNDGTILYNAGSNDFYMVNVSTAAGQFRTTTLNDDKVSALKYTLNRDDYLKYVDKIAKESGARAAMQNIMDSVSLCRNEFRNDTLANLMGLYGKINSLVEKIGTVDKEMHYFRNELNRAPETLEELIRINYTLPADKKWAIMPVKGSLFHMQGTDGFFNLKFVSGDGYHEAVYNMEGSLLTADNDAINMGTYNYFPATIDSAAHTNYDVNPYFEHGNISDTWQKGKVRILAGASDAAENYAINITAAEIWRYKTIKKGSFKEVEIK